MLARAKRILLDGLLQDTKDPFPSPSYICQSFADDTFIVPCWPGLILSSGAQPVRKYMRAEEVKK